MILLGVRFVFLLRFHFDFHSAFLSLFSISESIFFSRSLFSLAHIIVVPLWHRLDSWFRAQTGHQRSLPILEVAFTFAREKVRQTVDLVDIDRAAAQALLRIYRSRICNSRVKKDGELSMLTSKPPRYLAAIQIQCRPTLEDHAIFMKFWLQHRG